MLNVTMLSSRDLSQMVVGRCAECRYTECHYAECRGAF
jgi:hypothetical protein